MIRLGRPEDILDIVDLVKEFYELTPYSEYLPFNQEKTYALAENILDLPLTDALVLVLDKDRVQGLIVAVVTEMFCSKEKFAAELVWYVRPGFRGKEALLLHEAYADWTRRLNLPLRVMSDIKGGSDLDRYYQKNGYEISERTLYKVN